MDRIDRNIRYAFQSLMQYALCFLACTCCFILYTCHDLNAQQKSTPIEFVESINEDEDGNKILFPSFVFAEPVMDEIYIIDSKSRIIVYTSDFFPLYTLGRGKGVFSPQALTVDADGNLYVLMARTRDNPRPRIAVFNACYKWVRDIYLDNLEGIKNFSPHRLAIDKEGNFYVAGLYYPGILILNNQGQFLDLLTPIEKGKEVQLNDVVIDKAGKIYLVSTQKSRIYVYDENRNLLFKFGEKGGSTAKLSQPLAVGVDNRDGRMYVVDYMRHTISAYDNEGKYLFEFGGLGWGEGWFQHPKDITVDPAGRVLIADSFNDRVEVYRPTEKKREKSSGQQ
jgi:DNA-binding beta-propeller fold protein YncE